MSEEAWRRRELHFERRGGLPQPRRPAPWRAVLAAVVAIAASAGMAWWFAAPDSLPDLNPQPTPSPASRPAVRDSQARFAADEPQPDQVRRAWRDVKSAYANGGADGLVRASSACANRTIHDPTMLDYCVALDIYASDIAPAGPTDWFGQTGARDMALARATLPPGADPANRIAQVGALTRLILREPAPAKPATATPQQVQTPHAAPHATVKKVQAPAKRPAKPKTLKASTREPDENSLVEAYCASEPTEVDRVVCAHSDLAAADRRMKSAYDQAIASGVDPQILGEEQEDWRQARDRAKDRKALRELYRKRIDDLESLAPPH